MQLAKEDHGSDLMCEQLSRNNWRNDMKRLVILAIASCACAIGIKAGVRDTTEISDRVEERYSLSKREPKLLLESAISLIDLYTSPMTMVNGVYSYGKSTLTPLAEIGGGRNYVGGHIDTYANVRGNNFMLEVEYLDGQARKVERNLTADALLLYPHLVAGNIYHDIHRSVLKAEVGFARDMQRWAIGMKLSAKSTHESDSDPVSPDNFACDLRAQMSLAKLTDRHRIGLEFSGQKYSQDTEPDVTQGFESSVYMSQGLGRVMLLEAYDVEYEGHGMSVAAMVTRRRGEVPLQAMLRYGRMGLKGSNVTGMVTKQENRDLRAEVCYSLDGKFWKQLQLDLGIEQRRTKTGQNYDSDCPELKFSAIGRCSVLQTKVEMGYMKRRERNEESVAKLEVGDFRSGVGVGLVARGKRLLAAPLATLKADFAVDDKCVVLQGEPETNVVNRRIGYYSKNRFSAQLGVPMTWNLGHKFALMMTPELYSELHSGGEKTRWIKMKIGLCF